MRIGDVAHQAGVSTRALRYYEEQGLLPSERTASGQRSYPESAVERVRLIQQFFTAGLPSRTIVQLLPCVDTGHGSPEAFELLATERDRIT
ncbi:MAG TPA: MerR family transcriptional regulator, partial [Lacisediminihabitans sp.]|uniref:MerR family transcriptional regulator n=1 Tax=Lacisediminihabitans sp. TaxID=2787631 RepID=UPI002EDB146A